jgi:Arylsulfotransferase (ASST)
MGTHPREKTARADVITRRSFLRAGGTAAGVLATGGNALAAWSPPAARHMHRRASPASAPQGLSFHSRPDLRPPVFTVNVARSGTAPGHLFLGPNWGEGSQAGALILDQSGQPIFFQPSHTSPKSTQWATNVGVQRYKQKPAMVWWEGAFAPPSYGRGSAVILDQSYRQLLRVRAANGRSMDLHEFQLTPQGTALFTCYPRPVEADLSSIGGPKSGQVLESVFQEVDLSTGRLLLEWRALDHISISESYVGLGRPWDFMHLNSIDVLPDGNLLISARHTFAIYKLDRKTGKVIWRLGGKRSNFDLGRGASFAWQHDARHIGRSLISVFDDESYARPGVPRRSRGLMLDVDERHKTARLAQQWLPPGPLVALVMGNVQTLPDGHVVVGWGSASHVSEFRADGRLLLDMQVPGVCAPYRGFRFPWTGVPSQPPAVAAATNSRTGETALYASWNGATTLARWQVLSGSSPTQLAAVATVARQGFETAIPLGRASGYVAVAALDASGRRLATSAVTKL